MLWLMISSKQFVFALITFVVIIYFYIPDYIIKNSKVVEHLTKKPLCKLKLSNPWDPSILQYLKPKKLVCEPEILQIIYLEKNYVKINTTMAKNETDCQWQCMNHIMGMNYKKSSWQSIITVVSCDIFRVRCFTNGDIKKVYYEQMHTQITPKQLNSKNEGDGYSLHILVLDSVSRSQAIRFLPKTLNYLIHEFEAVDFLFHNKIAFNSDPNAHAAFIGKHPNNSRTAPIFTADLQDNQTFENHYIGNILQNNNFPTLLNEDVLSVFRMEKLKPMHILYPFLQKSFNWKQMSDCYSLTLKYILKYWSQFITTYGKKQKFSLNWNTHLSHDGLSSLFIADNLILDFLIKHKKEFDKSFFILMADHGSMFGYHRFEKAMAYEDNNPMLFISFPKKLRFNKEIIETLKENSQKLTSHYDLYATLIEIAKLMNATIPSDITQHGRSLFHKIPDRDCYSMGIPPPYCICRFDEKILSSKKPLHVKIVNSIITEANTALMPYRNTCIIFEKDPNFVPEIIELDITNNQNYKIFKVTFQTKYFKNNSRWWTYVYVDPTEKEIKNMLDFGQRIDPYGNGKRCLKNMFWFCYCDKIK